MREQRQTVSIRTRNTTIWLLKTKGNCSQKRSGVVMDYIAAWSMRRTESISARGIWATVVIKEGDMKVNRKNLLCAMVRADMNNQKLSDASGISITQVSNIRNGNNTTYETISKIANALNVSLENLVEGMDSANTTKTGHWIEQESDDFARWVATEIFDDNWEYNKDAFAEIACRKLEKLGIVRAKGDEWELVEPQESEDNE